MPSVLFSTKPQKLVGDRQEFYLSVAYPRQWHGVCEAVGKALCRSGESVVLAPGSRIALGDLLMRLVRISAPQFQKFPGVNNDYSPMLILVWGLGNAHEDRLPVG